MSKNGNPIRLPLPPPGANQIKWLVKLLPVKPSPKLFQSMRWWNNSRELMDLKRKGFIPGVYGLFYSLVPLFLAIGCFQNRHQVIGIENMREFARKTGRGKKFGVWLPDHKAFADVFLVQVAFVKLGYWGIACKRLIALIGSIYVECQPVESLLLSASNRIVMIPPTIIRQRKPKGQKEERRTRVEEFALAGATAWENRLLGGDTGLLFGEGTRSRAAKILRVPAGITALLDKQDYLLLPIAIEGSEGMWPPARTGFFVFPDLLHRTKVIVGRPLPSEEVRERALCLSKNFAVTFQQAFADVIYWEVGELHKKYGNRKYAGVYDFDKLEDLYKSRTTTLTHTNEG